MRFDFILAKKEDNQMGVVTFDDGHAQFTARRQMTWRNGLLKRKHLFKLEQRWTQVGHLFWWSADFIVHEPLVVMMTHAKLDKLFVEDDLENK